MNKQGNIFFKIFIIIAIIVGVVVLVGIGIFVFLFFSFADTASELANTEVAEPGEVNLDLKISDVVCGIDNIKISFELKENEITANDIDTLWINVRGKDLAAGFSVSTDKRDISIKAGLQEFIIDKEFLYFERSETQKEISEVGKINLFAKIDGKTVLGDEREVSCS